MIGLVYMPLPDLDYLRRIEDRSDPTVILREPQFLDAQKLFFSIVEFLEGEVDFEIADMREVHAVAALGDVHGKKVLDIGCGSTEKYVLENTFRDAYPPFFAEMLAAKDAKVTGIDIRPNPTAHYDHRVLDLTKENWMEALSPPYDIIACLSIFNAPESPFEHESALCDRIMKDVHSLLAPDGLAIVTLRDELFEEGDGKKNAEDYLYTQKFQMLHCDGNCAWIQSVQQ